MSSQVLETVIQVDVTVLAFLAGTVIPLLTALVTKLQASSRVKAIVNLVLSLLAGSVAHLVAHDGQSNWMNLVTAMVAVYLASGVSYQNFWKPTGTSVAVQEKTSSVGLGYRVTHEGNV